MAANDDAKELKSIVDAFNSQIKDLNDSLKSTSSLVGESINPFKEILTISQQLNDHRSKENELTLDQIKNLSEKVKKEKENLLNADKALDVRFQHLVREQKKFEDILRVNRGNTKAYKDANKSLEATLKEINENVDAQANLYDQIEKSTSEVEKLEKGLAKAAERAKQIQINKDIGKGLDKISTPLDGMLNPLNLINKLISFIFGAVVETDDQLGKAAKSMNMTYQAAADSRGEMVKMAKASKDIFANSAHIEETLISINDSLGSNVAFESMSESFQKDVTFLSKMSHYAGLTADEVNGIAKLTLATNQSAEKFTGELMGQVKLSGIQKGIILNEKTALKDISKTSAAIKMSFDGSAKGLGDAYAKAKALGTSLNKVDDIAGSILNFEESIEAELSAELLLGKDLNLEKAREAALNNDLATLSEEIAKNVGSAADFSKMNRLQQESIAKAVGMTREELASSLMEQEALKNIGAASLEDARAKYDKLRETMTAEEALKALGDEQLAQQFEQQSIQEQLGAAQLKMADETMPSILETLKTVNANFQTMFDKVKEIFHSLGGMKTILVVIGSIIALKLVKGVFDFISGASAAMKVLREIKILERINAGISIVRSAWASVGAIPVVGPVLAAGAITAGMAGLYALMNDGVISPSTGGSGYGSRVLHGPEGAISFNNKDTIVAGTDLFKTNDMVSAPQGTVQIASNNDSSKDIAELKSAILALASRPVDVAIDGKKVIEATTGANPNTQGLESAKNSFKMQ
jgi:hypothetical protein